MHRIVCSSPSIGDPNAGNIARNAPVSVDRSAGSSPRFSERRISLQDYSFAFMLLDSATIVVSGIVLSYLFGLRDPQATAGWANPSLIIVTIFYLLASIGFRTYSSSVVLDRRNMIRRLFSALGATFGLFLVLAEMTNSARDYSRPWFFLWALVSSLLIVTIRFTAQAYVRHSLQNGAFVDKSLSVGMFCDPLSEEELARETDGMTRVARSMRLDELNELAALSDEIASAEIDQVHISTPWQKAPVVLKNVSLLRHLSAEVIVMPFDPHIDANMAGDKAFGRRSPGRRVSLRAVERPISGWNLWIKRKEDIVIAGLALMLLSPLLLLIALLIRLESDGPILFRQRRVGFNGSIFEVLKFRTMYLHHTDPDATCQTGKGDPRVTRVGRIIRRMSLDELPQFINVLQGTMSVVGPRPHALQTQTNGKNLDELVEHYAARHRVKPGITGWAQVHGLRGELDNVEKLRRRVGYDIEYIDKWSIWVDLKILLKTMPLVLYDRHAY